MISFLAISYNPYSRFFIYSVLFYISHNNKLRDSLHDTLSLSKFLLYDKKGKMLMLTI